MPLITIYLKNRVQGKALTFIAHLEPGDSDVYDECIKALKEQYLDEPFIVDEYFKKLLSDKPEFDETYGKTRLYIANTRNHLHNLNTHYKVDLMDESNSAHKFLSHVIFSKLSQELRNHFSWDLKTDYPKFQQILDNYCKIITRICHNKRQSKPVSHFD